MIAAMIFVTQEAKAFEAGDLNGRAVLSLLRTNDAQAPNRINLILPNVEYKRLIYQAEYNFDFNDQKDPQKYQQKTLVGVKVIDDLSLRYQYENNEQITETTTQKVALTTTKGVTTGKIVSNTITKDNQWHDNRYGIGYRQFTTIDGNKIGYDVMVLKEEIYDARGEINIFLENKYVDVRNQFYSDYNDFNIQKFYDRFIVLYKLNSYTRINTQVAWQTDKGLAERIGVTFSF